MIFVVGSINLDLIGRVGRLPAPGETVSGSDFSTAPGGKGANQALAARRAGSEVHMVGAVGNDAFAPEATALLAAGGVDLSRVRHVDTATGVALILVGGDAENMIAVVPGANGAVSVADAANAGMGEGDFVLLQNEIPLETVQAALKAARSVGAVSLLNLAPFGAELARIARDADILIVNEIEFDLLCRQAGLAGGDRAARMQAWVASTGRIVVVTLGADGVIAAAPDMALALPAMKIEPVDTVGAGDTFCGYLAQGLQAGLGLEQAIRRAGVAGSLACLKPGAQPAIPQAGEVGQALRGWKS
ncbi:MAG: ribokinase [Rhizobiaceae bacterium]|nr:ribokinase [Rhizobiaceae bacterium]